MKTKKPAIQQLLSQRFTLRISRQDDQALQGLGRFEKRRMAEMVRACLKKSLDTWYAAHPGRSPFKPKRRAIKP